MLRFHNFLIATIFLVCAVSVHQAEAREPFYNLSNTEPSVSINLGAIDNLQQPAYEPPPPVKTYKKRSKNRAAIRQQQADYNHQTAKNLPVVSDSIEPVQAPPKPTKSKLQHAAPPLPVVTPDVVASTPNLPPSPPPLPKVEEQPLKTLPIKPEKKVPDIAPSPPHLMPEIKETKPLPLPPASTDLPPPPPPLPKAEIPKPNISASSDASISPAGMPRVIVSSKKPPTDLPKVTETKNNDNIVALPPAPPPPPVAPVNNKTLVAASKDLALPPPLPTPPKVNNDMIPLPPPLPPSAPQDLDKKIADEKAKINAEEIKSKAAIKNAGTKMPTPKDLARTSPSVPDLPIMPPPPPALDTNGLPPLPGAPGDAAPTKTASLKPSDLPPLPTLPANNQTTSAIEPKGSVASKETVMVQQGKLPADSNVNSGVTTMSYSEAETEVPLVEKAKLDGIISQLATDKSKSVTVIAYASGTPEQASQAKRTSLARVLAVRKYMMDRNIDADRINPRPLGNKAESGVPDRVDMIIEHGARG